MNYLNANSSKINFQKTLKRKIYVDKSLLIGPLNELIGTDECYICITRPRRFGKTINANMLGAYYTRGLDSGELFQSLQVSESLTYAEHLNQHNVIYIDFSRTPDVCTSYEDYINSIRQNLYNDLLTAYPALQMNSYDSISQLFRSTGDAFIFILDEWDAIFQFCFMFKKEADSEFSLSLPAFFS